MDRNVQQLEVLKGGSAYGVDTNRVLRNTYWLLALSMIPTVLGAWIGVQTGIVSHMTPGMSMIVFFIGAYGLMFGVIDCGQVLVAHQALVERVRSAARWGVVHPWDGTGRHR